MILQSGSQCVCNAGVDAMAGIRAALSHLACSSNVAMPLPRPATMHSPDGERFLPHGTPDQEPEWAEKDSPVMFLSRLLHNEEDYPTFRRGPSTSPGLRLAP